MRRKSHFLQMRFFKWVICRVVRRIAYKCDFLRCIYVALKMDATYMQKDKIARRCEIATIALTSRFQYETYAAYISMSHISADMTFALRTHCFFDGASVRFLQSDVCEFSFRWQICRIFSMRYARQTFLWDRWGPCSILDWEKKNWNGRRTFQFFFSCGIDLTGFWGKTQKIQLKN